MNLLNISIILAHPNPGSFNHAIAMTAAETLRRNGHLVKLHDLCQEQFPPLLSAAELRKDAELDPVVAQHCREIIQANGIIIVHPNWWGMPPAILKGWIDRVLRPGVAYRFVEGDQGEGVPVGLLKAGAALVFNTANTPDAREREVFGDPLETLWKNCVFGLCGVKNVHRRTFTVVITSTPDLRAGWLAETRNGGSFLSQARITQAPHDIFPILCLRSGCCIDDTADDRRRHVRLWRQQLTQPHDAHALACLNPKLPKSLAAPCAPMTGRRRAVKKTENRIEILLLCQPLLKTKPCPRYKPCPAMMSARFYGASPTVTTCT